MKSTASSPHTAQASAFEAVPQRSLCMTLCLNGAVPVLDLAGADRRLEWLESYLDSHYPSVVPGETGPITIVLVL